ncbi:anthrone oxygenase family protein [uncultured Leifsonia sp.]|uniref:anthrone oxygenase family protein n=1 Tax=uncultured Leifsonia sp. TaxID=340359 RepID=UPI0028D3B537|nr:anthrone oxygenase family protein [uncultured Leifsonia sp.]
MQTATTILIAIAALTTAAAGGVYLGFSALVMPALARSRDGAGAAAAMNRINVLAPRSSFLIAFLGSALACVAAGVLVLGRLPALDALLALLGAVLGVAGFAITVAVNIPLNNRLAASGDDAAAFAAFERPWRRANSARGAVSLVGAASLVAALAV